MARGEQQQAQGQQSLVARAGRQARGLTLVFLACSFCSRESGRRQREGMDAHVVGWRGIWGTEAWGDGVGTPPRLLDQVP